jgi:hypothetical protein
MGERYAAAAYAYRVAINIEAEVDLDDCDIAITGAALIVITHPKIIDIYTYRVHVPVMRH